jgi:AraC-like DNA-binding protein
LLCIKNSKNESKSDKWLAFFLLLCIFFIAPWMLGFAGWYDKQPYRDIIFYLPIQQLFFIGPIIFFYVQSLLNPSFTFKKKEWLHLLPGILYLMYSLTIFMVDKVILHKYYFLADGMDRDFDSWYQYAGFASMLTYFFISLRYYQLYKKLMVQVISYADMVLFSWVKKFLIAFLCMLLLRLVFYVGSFIPAFTALDNVGPWWEYFSFAIIFYYVAITGYSNNIHAKIPFKLHLLSQKALLLLQPNIAINNTNTIEAAEIIEFEHDEQPTVSNDLALLLADWKPKILHLIEKEKIYEDAELSLTQVAKLLQTNVAIISKVINKGFDLNFNDFVNFYRIKAVQVKLIAGQQKVQTLLGIAYYCGFNSKDTFNRSFKKATGISPKEWVEKNIHQ